MQPAKKKGFIIVFEGGDGCGTTTHSRMLAEGIRGWLPHFGAELLESMGLNGGVINLSGPSDSEFGRSIKEKFEKGSIKDPIASTMYFALDRLEQCDKIVNPHLEMGFIVIMDRYVHSSMVHQGLQGATEEFVLDCNRNATLPDLIFYLKADPNIIISRLLSRENDPTNKDPDLFQNIMKQQEAWQNIWSKSSKLEYPSRSFQPYIIDTGLASEYDISKKILSEATAQILEKCLIRAIIKFD